MIVVLTMCTACSLTVLKANTEMMCLEARAISDAASKFSVKTVSKGYK